MIPNWSGKNKATKDSSLGKSLMKKKKNKLNKQMKKNDFTKDMVFVHYNDTEEKQKEKAKYQSVIDQNSLNEFLINAELQNKNFEAQKGQKLILTQKNQSIMIDVNKLRENQGNYILTSQSKKLTDEYLKDLRIPRKPQWDKKMSGEQLHQLENLAFVNWRKDLAKIEENLHLENLSMSPYERNIEIWKELWQVVERSDVIVQIIDSRDPLFYRNKDLEKFVSESGKKANALLINKSDLIDEVLLESWKKYFIEEGTKGMFFSGAVSTDDEVEALMQWFASLSTNKEVKIGMVGYPNVGKSTVINRLVGKKVVGVGRNAGKTRHWQTVQLNDNILLLDCPGLTFPRVGTRGEMIINGVVNVEQVKDWQGVVCELSRIQNQQWQKLGAKKGSLETKLKKVFDLRQKEWSEGIKWLVKEVLSGKVKAGVWPPGMEPVEDNQPILEEQQEEEEEKEKEGLKVDEVFFDESMVWDEWARGLSEDEMLGLIEGKKVKGIKLNKQARREIKFEMKRNEEGVDLMQMILNEVNRSQPKVNQVQCKGKYEGEDFLRLADNQFSLEKVHHEQQQKQLQMQN